MALSDNTIQAEGLGIFFKTLGMFSAKTSKNLATKILKIPGTASENTSNIATAAANRSLKKVLSTLPEVIDF